APIARSGGCWGPSCSRRSRWAPGRARRRVAARPRTAHHPGTAWWPASSTATPSRCGSTGPPSGCGSSGSTPPSPWPATDRSSATARRPRPAWPSCCRWAPRCAWSATWRPGTATDGSSPTCSGPRTTCTSTTRSCSRGTPRPAATSRTWPARGSATPPRRRRRRRSGACGRPAAARTRRSRAEPARPAGGRTPGERGRTGSVGAVTTDSSPTLAERLGYGPEDRLLIINCDDLGACHAANVGTYEALRDGIATSATLMVPCPWSREAAARYRGEDVGVHLTLNAEYDLYRWGPITRAPSLLDGDGGFPRTVTDVWEHADLDEVRRELRAQIERAILWGFDVSHLDSHMGTLQLRPEFFDVYLDLAVEFELPIRLSGAATERLIGFPFRRLAAEEGVVFPDHFVYVQGGVGSRRAIEQAVTELRPGVTEVNRKSVV